MLVDIRKFKSFPTFKRRFLEKIPKKDLKKENKNNCWNWLFSKDYNGYGQLTWGGKRYYAHRISYIIFNGLIPYNKIVRHKCNNTSCINPKHLILGSYSANSIDLVKAGNQRSQKLNEEAVKVIKWMLKYKNEKGMTSKLTKIYKISPSMIHKIHYGQCWGWVKIL